MYRVMLLCFLYSSLALGTGTALLWLRLRWPRSATAADALAVPAVCGAPYAVLAWRYGPCGALAVLALTGAVLIVAARRRFRRLNTAGVALLLAQAQLPLVWLVWAVGFVTRANIDPTSQVLLALVVLVFAAGVPAEISTAFVQYDVLRRRAWHRPSLPYAPPRTQGHMVSVHLACHNEPPDMVNATLDALAALHYEDFEVVVVDNNTRDPALWEPVRQHCAQLGPRFTFLHLDPLTGAKAGALNAALACTSARADLVAVVDADNQVTPDFLARLVGHFEDPRLGFIQTWYDFRDWDHSPFMTGCFWEYRFTFPVTMRTYNEHGAGFPIGTVCLFRRTVLEQVGGWATWCLTEDSELGTRIHAAGHTSLIVNQTFGRGLIPETLAAYKKQRYRWTFGPSQALRRHWRLYLPRPWATPSHLTPLQKFYGLSPLLTQIARVSCLFAPLAVTLALASMLAHHDHMKAIPAIAAALVVGYTARQALRWLLCRTAVGCTPRQAALLSLAAIALAYTTMTASLAGFRHSDTDWRHTKKFPSTRRLRSALTDVRNETALSLFLLTVAACASWVDHSGQCLMLEGWLALRGTLFTVAPLTALLAERSITTHTRAHPPADLDPASTTATLTA